MACHKSFDLEKEAKEVNFYLKVLSIRIVGQLPVILIDQHRSYQVQTRASVAGGYV
jgi:hypothetical protein